MPAPAPASNHSSAPQPEPEAQAGAGKLKIVVSRMLPPQGQRLLEDEAEKEGWEVVQWNGDCPCPRQWLLDNVAGATGLLVMLTEKIDQEVVDAAGERLRVMSTMSVGVDHISLPCLTSPSHPPIRLGHTPNVLTPAVADLAVMLTLMTQRRAGEAIRAVLAGQWPSLPWSPMLFAGPGIEGKTVGFLGFGRIAKEILRRLVPFGIARAVYARGSGGGGGKDKEKEKEGACGNTDADHGLDFPCPIPVSRVLDPTALAQASDILIIACSLTPSTHHLISTPFLSRMKPSAILINIARGPIVDTEALITALKEKTIFAAGLDVVEGEPNIGAEHKLLGLENCVILPHIGSASCEAREGMARMSVRNLVAGVREGDMLAEWV